jgi:hypothetical protein
MVAMFVNGSGQHEQSLERTFQQAILVSDWLISKKKSSLMKPLGQMNRNLVGSIHGKSSIKIAHLVPIVNKHGRHRQYQSETRIAYGGHVC